MRKSYLILIMFVFTFVILFGCEKSPVDSQNEVDTAPVSDLIPEQDNAQENIEKMDDTEIITLIENTLYGNGLKLVNWINSGSGLNLDYDISLETNNPAVEYVLVKNIPDMQSFKAICEEIFSRDFLSSYVYPALIENDYSLFTENDGKLYYNKNTGGAYPFVPDFTRANVTSNDVVSFEIEVPMQEADDTEGKIFIFKVVRQHENWVLDSFHYFQR